MKRVVVITVMVLGFVVQGWGQEMGNFKEKHRVNLLGFGDTKFKYQPKDSLTILKKTNILYDKDGNIVSYNTKEVKKVQESKPLDETVFKSLGLKSTWSNVNISKKDGKVFIYPFTYSKKDEEKIKDCYNDEKKKKILKRNIAIATENDTIDKINEFFINNNVYLELKDRHNYPFRYSAVQLGLVTLPFKWYMSSELGNVETDINAMVNIGYKWGKTRIAKLPHEDNARQYQSAWSVNGLIGFSKLSIDENNRTEESSVKGNVAAFSTGASLALHYSDFTFMLASGFDLPLSNRKDWKFNGTPWLGIGIGYNFLKNLKFEGSN